MLSSRHSHGDQRTPLCSGLSPCISSHPFGVFMSHGDTVLHLRQQSSLESGVKRSRQRLERSAKGTAVMWDSETQCNIIYSRDGISHYKQTLAFGQNVFFFFFLFQTHLSQEKSQRGKMILAENNSSHERANRQPNKTQPKIRSLEPGQFPHCQM